MDIYTSHAPAGYFINLFEGLALSLARAASQSGAANTKTPIDPNKKSKINSVTCIVMALGSLEPPVLLYRFIPRHF